MQMASVCRTGGRMFSRFMHFLRNLATEVPEDIAVCEFDCDRTECMEGDWRHCERRRSSHAGQQQDMDDRVGN